MNADLHAAAMRKGCRCEKRTIGRREVIVAPDPDCPRHGIREGVMAVPHLRRHAQSGEDDRSAEARLYAEAGTRRSLLAVPAASLSKEENMIEQREGRPHEVAETYVPTIHGEPHEGYLHEGAPVLDQAEGTTAASETATARREVEGQLADGTLSLGDLFEMNAGESGDSHRVIGHMHVRAALLALKGIGEVKAEAILAEVGIEGDRHIATLGANQQEQLAIAVSAHL